MKSFFSTFRTLEQCFQSKVSFVFPDYLGFGNLPLHHFDHLVRKGLDIGWSLGWTQILVHSQLGNLED